MRPILLALALLAPTLASAHTETVPTSAQLQGQTTVQLALSQPDLGLTGLSCAFPPLPQTQPAELLVMACAGK